VRLYDLELSGNAYRVRLMLALLGLKAELRAVGLMKGENRQEWFLKLNPRGQVPVFEDDDGHVVWDSMAILIYLARKYGGEAWLPLDPKGMAEVMQWLAVTENECLYGMGKARVLVKFGFPGNLEEAQALAHKGLGVLEARLAAAQWLALERPTLADIGCFPYVALAPEGRVALEPYPGVRRWVERVKALPGFVGMPGV
jgi:glutathione S-transferase